MTALDTKPWSVSMATSETIGLTVDVTNLLTGNQTPTAVSTSLVDITSTASVHLADSPTVSGNSIGQEIHGSALTAGHFYQLAVTFTPSGTVTVLTTTTTIQCVATGTQLPPFPPF